MWHPGKNTSWTPQTISVDSDVEVWWLCPAGHEWIEAVRDRTAPRKWKGGRVDACGDCLGYHVLKICGCGEARLAKASAGAPREGARTDYVADVEASQRLRDPSFPPGCRQRWPSSAAHVRPVRRRGPRTLSVFLARCRRSRFSRLRSVAQVTRPPAGALSRPLVSALGAHGIGEVVSLGGRKAPGRAGRRGRYPPGSRGEGRACEPGPREGGEHET
ncbi:zinc-ribbon domain-containing protein [Amycolatopsis sp. CA-230715]|uniref:zinc-ribbon domain-containing protein n=1 Tax=Amycolatopsis sp. CA-230715 TaxID=2745196 RepID=UPI003FA4C5E9